MSHRDDYDHSLDFDYDDLLDADDRLPFSYRERPIPLPKVAPLSAIKEPSMTDRATPPAAPQPTDLRTTIMNLRCKVPSGYPFGSELCAGVYRQGHQDAINAVAQLAAPQPVPASPVAQPSDAVEVLRKVWLEAGGNPAITEPTEQSVLDLVHGLNKLVDEYEAEDRARSIAATSPANQEDGNG